MLDLNEAIRSLRLLWCKDHYTDNEIYEYHTCLNMIEEALCDKGYIMIDPSTFNSESPEQCMEAVQKAIKGV